MFEKSSQRPQECIFFLNETGVIQEMMYAEFEAVLDGVVGLSDFANSIAFCIYAVINPGLQVTALVFFTVAFDERGEPPRDWNVPFQSLIQKSATVRIGPYEAKVVSRSACAVEWHRSHLWDPSEEVIQYLVKAIETNRLCLTTTSIAESAMSQTMPSFVNQAVMNFDAVSSSPSQQVVPTSLPDLVQEVAQQLSTGLSAPSPKADDFEKKYLAVREQLAQQKMKYSEMIEQLKKNRDKRVQQAVTETKVALKHKYEKKLKSYEQEYKSRYTSKMNEMQMSASVTAQALQDTNHVLVEKDELLVEKKRQLEEHKSLLAHSESVLQEKNVVLAQLEITVKKLSEELAGFRKEKLRLLAHGADKFFERLEQSGLSFIAFHPGAGHVSVPVSRVAEYLDNPSAFAAEKIGISEEAYLSWLQHYEKPCCNASIIGGTTCGQKIQRHENPRDFTPGIYDRCEKHRTGVGALDRTFSS